MYVTCCFFAINFEINLQFMSENYFYTSVCVCVC